MAHTRLWCALILGLVELGGLACSKSDSPNLVAQEPLVLDPASDTLSLDETQVPVVPSCASGQLVQKSSTGWACVTPGPNGVPVTWDSITDKPEQFPPSAHTHPWSEVTGAPDFALASSVQAVTSRVSSVEGNVTDTQGKLSQVTERVTALEAGGGASSVVMSIHSNDGALTGAGYSMVGLGRPESFTARASLPSATSHVLGAAVLGTKVYVAGGYVSSSQQCVSNLWEYDLASNTWTARQQMSVARHGHLVVGAHGKVYVIGGYCTDGIKATEIYDPQLNVWTTGAPLPDHNHYAAAFGILSDGKLHVVGGYDHSSGSTTASRSHVVYDFEANSWSTAPALPAPRAWAASGVLPDGRLIVAGGYNGASYGAETFIFDPVANAWTQVASMPTTLNAHAGAVIDGRFHTFAGHTGSAYTNSHYTYDPASDTWSTGTATPFAGYVISVAQLRGGALLIGGWPSGATSATSAVYEYLAPLYLYSK